MAYHGIESRFSASWMDDTFVQDLIDRAQHTPYSHLEGYMNRWWVNPPKDGIQTTARIHQILRSDADRHLHDHPWDYTSVILRGCYIEERAIPGGDYHGRLTEKTMYKAGSVIQRVAADAHKLVLPDGPVWSLFISGPYVQRWGFLTPEGKVSWREYLGEAAVLDYESSNPFNSSEKRE